MVARLPLDASVPPPEPPAGCTNPEGWSRAYEQIVVHQLGEVHEREWLCMCGETYPCAVLVAAIRGLLRACGLAVAAPP